jgi:hypothetical protein
MTTIGKESGPIRGQSHWCDGRTLSGKKCRQVVSNDNDHCAAGHPNKIRQRSIKTSERRGNAKTSSPTTRGELSLTTDTLLDSAPQPPTATVLEQATELFAGIIEGYGTPTLDEGNIDSVFKLMLFPVENGCTVGIWTYEYDPYWDTLPGGYSEAFATADPRRGSWSVSLYDVNLEPVIDPIEGAGWDDLRDVMIELREYSRTGGKDPGCDHTNCLQAVVREVLGKRLCASHASEFEEFLNSRYRRNRDLTSEAD